MVVLTDPDVKEFVTEVARAYAYLGDRRNHAVSPVPAPDYEARRRTRQGQRRLTPEQIKQLVARYQAGATVYELADEFKCDRTTVSKKLKDAGITLRRTPPTESQIDEMVRLYESGLSLERTGEKVGFTAHTVLTYLRRRGVQTRGTHEKYPKDLLLDHLQ